MPPARVLVGALALALVAGSGWSGAAAEPLPTTREDFRLPGTQPLSLTHEISTPDDCTGCHADYGSPEVEPFRTWQGSMMAQAGRDPLLWAALAVANQDAPHAGETCLRCHLPKGWLEGRSAPEDGTAMTAEDRQGVQCGVCHRLVDPLPHLDNPPEDAAILGALGAPVPGPGGAMMVLDPEDRMRGPFDVVADLGSDPHAPARSTLVSPFHATSEMCGVCHNLRNPVFVKSDETGAWELTAMDTASPDPTKGFPEQSTFDEWAASAYARGGVEAPEFGGNKTLVSTCQDCHMPDVTGRDAEDGPVRSDLPHHTFAGANTFIPAVLPFHPAWGNEVDAEALAEGIEVSTRMLRKAATLEGVIEDGILRVRVTNETGHKLPTGYPEGRRMWLHVRALDGRRNVVLESGRYVFATATLIGSEAGAGEPGHDPHLRIWEAEQGMSEEVAAAAGLPPGRSFHLALNNLRLKDNRIPPRGFTIAGFAAVDAEPVPATYADDQYWDDVFYPVGANAVSAEVTLYYQTASREYVEFLRDENTTTAAGETLFELWEQHNQSLPVEMARLTVAPASTLKRCHRSVARAQRSYLRRYLREWSRCYSAEAAGRNCDAADPEARIAAAAAKLEARVGGVKDRACRLEGLTPASLGHGSTCPPPCSHLPVFDMVDLASCSQCVSAALADASLEAAYGTLPSRLPRPVPSGSLSCQKRLGQASAKLADQWSSALERCARDNALGKNDPALDCPAADPGGKIQKARSRAAARIDSCEEFAGIDGCPERSADVAACVDQAVGDVVSGVPEVPYP
jgi:hypothetical protein